MTRNLKVLGLALVAVLAIGAMAASAATAATAGKFTASSYPVHVFGEDTDDTFTVSENTLACTKATFTGQASEASTQLDITPVYTGCTNNGVDPVTVTMNGCFYRFTAGTATAPSGTTHTAHGSVHIICEPGKVIEIHRYSSHANHTAGITNCTITVGPQAASGSVTYTSHTTPGDVTVEGDVVVSAQLHSTCSFGFTINVNSTYHSGVTTVGTNNNKIHVG